MIIRQIVENKNIKNKCQFVFQLYIEGTTLLKVPLQQLKAKYKKDIDPTDNSICSLLKVVTPDISKEEAMNIVIDTTNYIHCYNNDTLLPKYNYNQEALDNLLKNSIKRIKKLGNNTLPYSLIEMDAYNSPNKYIQKVF